VIVAIASGVVLLLAVAAVAVVRNRRADVVIGVPSTTTALPGPTIVLEPSTSTSTKNVGSGDFAFADPTGRGTPGAEPASAPGLKRPDGHPWPPAVEFTSEYDVPSGLIFTLVIGSDARPKEDLRKTRADSLHLVAVNPATRQGTILGFPRDSWVEIPGHGRGKINDAMAIGGPDLLARTVRKLTGLPVDYYVLTGFTGFSALVDEIGGVDVQLDRRMNDPYSGARFERGWQHFNGGEALAFSRDRHEVAYGDFSRSEHQGEVMLAGLAKLRGRVGDDNGLVDWLDIMLRHVELDVPMSKLPQLAALVRRLDPARLTNVVAPGRVGTAGSASVVYLTRDAAALFDDLRADGVVGGAAGEATTTTSTTAPASSTTTSSTSSTTTTSTTISVGIVPTTSTTLPGR
jgi:LCP family protein required for cell wall assembly